MRCRQRLRSGADSRAAACPKSERWRRVGWVRSTVRYLEHGSGVPLVVLHGAGVPAKVISERSDTRPRPSRFRFTAISSRHGAARRRRSQTPWRKQLACANAQDCGSGRSWTRGRSPAPLIVRSTARSCTRRRSRPTSPSTPPRPRPISPSTTRMAAAGTCDTYKPRCGNWRVRRCWQKDQEPGREDGTAPYPSGSIVSSALPRQQPHRSECVPHGRVRRP